MEDEEEFLVGIFFLQFDTMDQRSFSNCVLYDFANLYSLYMQYF